MIRPNGIVTSESTICQIDNDDDAVENRRRKGRLMNAFNRIDDFRYFFLLIWNQILND